MNSTTLPTDSRLDPRQVLAALDQRPTPAAYAQAARDLRALEQALPEIRIAQLSTFTSDALTQYLEVEIARVGRTAAIYTAPFNSVQQELLDPRSGCSTHQADIVFIAQLLEDVCPSLACDFLALSAADVEQLIAQTVSDCLAAITAFRRRSTAAIVVHTFPLPTAAALGIYEPMASESQTKAIRRLNLRFGTMIEQILHCLEVAVAGSGHECRVSGSLRTPLSTMRG